MSNMSIVVKDVEKEYETFKLNVSLEVPKGRIVGLIGENGAGKSTLLKIILNLVEKKAGTVEIMGVSDLNKNREVLEDVGVVLDEGVLPENLDILRINNIMKRIFKRWDVSRYFNLIETFNLPKNKKIKDLSKGMKMKLELIVAMSHNPSLLILDEPTTGLDPIVREELLDMFLDFVQEENNSILFSSHIMEDLEKIADHIVFINNGKIELNELKDTLIYDWAVMRCCKEEMDSVDSGEIIGYKETPCGYDILIKNKEYNRKKYNDIIVDDISLGDIMSIFIKGNRG